MFLLFTDFFYIMKLTLSCRNVILDAEVVGHRSSEYLDFRSTEFTALSLFEDVTRYVPTSRPLLL